MTTPLFVEKIRHSTPREQQPGESCFKFIDRLNHSMLEGTREYLNNAIARLPTPLVPEFCARLKSRNNSDFMSACFELALLNTIRSHGLSAEFHSSKTPGSQPDIAVLDCGRVLGHIEATVVGHRDDDTLFRFIQGASRKIRNRNLRIALHQFRRGIENPRPAEFAKFVDAEGTRALDRVGHDPGNMKRIAESLTYSEPSGTHAIVSIHWADAVASIEKLLWLSTPTESYWGNGLELLQERMAKKRRQHRGLATPVVLAIGWQNFKNEVDFEEFRQSIGCQSAGGDRRTNCLLMAPRFSQWSPQSTQIELWVAGDRAEPAWFQSWSGPVQSDSSLRG
jgi:hypothetical protein